MFERYLIVLLSYGCSKWHAVPPVALFDAPIVQRVPQDKEDLRKQLIDEAKDADALVLWLDCDREGEAIAFEVIQIVRVCAVLDISSKLLNIVIFHVCVTRFYSSRRIRFLFLLSTLSFTSFLPSQLRISFVIRPLNYTPLQFRRPNIKVYRARFSALIERDIWHAVRTLSDPDERQSDAVLARSEIDLRLGVAFTRLQV